jgi:hypothetical protein
VEEGGTAELHFRPFPPRELSETQLMYGDFRGVYNTIKGLKISRKYSLKRSKYDLKAESK